MATGTTLRPGSVWVPFDTESIRPPDSQLLFSIRRPRLAAPAYQPLLFAEAPLLVPIEGTEIQIPDHSAFFAFTGFTPSPAVNRFWFWPGPLPIPDPEPIPPQPDPQTLFRFRNPQVIPPPPTQSPGTTLRPSLVWVPFESELIRPPDSQGLFRYRATFQSQPQPWWLFTTSLRPVVEEAPPSAPDHSLLFRFRGTAGAVLPQPFWIQPRYVGTAEPEPFPVLLDQQKLFRFRNPRIMAPPSQPYWWLVQRFIPAPEPEPLPRPVDQQLAFGLRGNPNTLIRVQATAAGVYQGVYFNIGDVFDVRTGDFSDWTVNYAPTGADPVFGWMKQVPSTYPLFQFALGEGEGWSSDRAVVRRWVY